MMLNNKIAEVHKKYGDNIIFFYEYTVIPSYECCGKQAQIVSKECKIELEKDGAVTYCTIRPNDIKKYVNTLIKKGYTIAFCGDYGVKVVT